MAPNGSEWLFFCPVGGNSFKVGTDHHQIGTTVELQHWSLNTEVECSAVSTLQFSTSVELEVGIVLVVSDVPVLGNGSNDFLAFWHEVWGR